VAGISTERGTRPSLKRKAGGHLELDVGGLAALAETPRVLAGPDADDRPQPLEAEIFEAQAEPSPDRGVVQHQAEAVMDLARQARSLRFQLRDDVQAETRQVQRGERRDAVSVPGPRAELEGRTGLLGRRQELRHDEPDLDPAQVEDLLLGKLELLVSAHERTHVEAREGDRARAVGLRREGEPRREEQRDKEDADTDHVRPTGPWDHRRSDPATEIDSGNFIRETGHVVLTTGQRRVRVRRSGSGSGRRP
jgi:hypothetical protein